MEIDIVNLKDFDGNFGTQKCVSISNKFKNYG
jgi:hypothetical protein